MVREMLWRISLSWAYPKGDMIQGDIRFSQLCRLCSVILLRLQEDLVHRTYDGTHLGKIIHKAHGGNERSHNTHGQDDGGEKYLCGQAAVRVEDPAHRQHRNKRGWERWHRPAPFQTGIFFIQL